MTQKVPAEEIEEIVGRERHPVLHFGRAVSEEEQFYILHSYRCLYSHDDLRGCKFSLALDNGVDFPVADTPLVLSIRNDFLVGHQVR